MAYTDIAEMAADDDLRRRLYACVAAKNVDNGAMWVDRWVWLLVAGDPAWSDAWAYAEATAAQTTSDVAETTAAPRRGWAGDVITDDMILSRVVAVWDDKGAI